MESGTFEMALERLVFDFFSLTGVLASAGMTRNFGEPQCVELSFMPDCHGARVLDVTVVSGGRTRSEAPQKWPYEKSRTALVGGRMLTDANCLHRYRSQHSFRDQLLDNLLGFRWANHK